MNTNSLSAYVHMGRGITLPLYAPVHILDDFTSIPPVVYALNEPISQPKDKSERSNVVFPEI